MGGWSTVKARMVSKPPKAEEVSPTSVLIFLKKSKEANLINIYMETQL